MFVQDSNKKGKKGDPTKKQSFLFDFLTPKDEAKKQKGNEADDKNIEEDNKKQINNQINANNIFQSNPDHLKQNQKINKVENSPNKQQTQSILNNQNYSENQLNFHKRYVEQLWEYRYTKYVDYAIKTKDWLKVFAFIGSFKEKCVEIVQKIVNNNFQFQQIDEVDTRYTMKKEGQIGIFLMDGIIIRFAKVINEKGNYNKKYVKNLHQQFLSINIVNNLTISMATQMPKFPRIRVPLSCLVKYLGFTALCHADPPCEGLQTLINGPTHSLYQSRSEAKQILNVIGKNLNLKPYRVLSASNQIIDVPFSITVELHKVTRVFADATTESWISEDSILYPQNQANNRLFEPQYYLLNLSKLWPLFIDSDIIKSTGYLRPQVVLSWRSQLSNAVFSKIGFEKDEKSELQLAQACKSVKDENIKALVKLLDEASFFIIDSISVENIMHQYGINIRFLGQVAIKFSLNYNKRVFQIEMVARILKKVFFTTIESCKETFKELLIQFLNFVFIYSKEGEKFFQEVIYPQVQKYYEYKIQDYPPFLQGGGLLHAICYHFGVKIKMIQYPFFKQMEAIFSTTHIIDIFSTAKSFDFETCELIKTCEKYRNKRKEGLYSECLTELHLLAASAKLSNSERTIGVTSFPQSNYYSQISELYKILGDFPNSFKFAELALKGIPEKHADCIKPYCVLIRYYSEKKQLNRCLQYYDKSLATLAYHLNTNHPLSISVYNTLGFQFLSSSDPSKCQKIFAKSYEICEQALGYMHVTSSKILLQLADLPLPPEKTINFLLQALTILENIDSDKQKIKAVCMKISELYQKIGNLPKVIYFARRSEHWKMQIIALQKLNQNKQVLELCNRIVEDVGDLSFLVQKSFSSYLKLLDSAPTSNLYKIFVSLKEDLPHQKDAIENIHEELKSELSSLTVSQYVKNNLNNLIIEIPDMLLKQNFYEGLECLLNEKDKRLAGLLSTYMNFLSIVGIKKAEKIFTEFRKVF